MAFNYSPKGVTDGLVLYLDAANSNSYVSGSTTWRDISRGGNDGTLVGGPTFDSGNGGSIVFDGTNDYLTTSQSLPSLQGNPIFSIGGWFKRSGDWSGGATWGFGAPNKNINSYNFNLTNTIGIDLYGNTSYNTNQTYSLTDWKHIIWTYNGSGFTTTNIIIYINSVPYTGTNLTVIRNSGATPNVSGSSLALGRVSPTENAYYGKPIIGNFMVYNKVLSPTEVLQNYNATKTRFGLI